MALEIKLQQKLTQTLVMTPQLQQAIKLLQLGRLEYLQVLEKELLENPVLEDARDLEEEVRSAERAAAEIKASLEEMPSRLGENQLDAFAEEGADGGDSALLKDNLWSASSGISGVGPERPSVEGIASREEDLASHLLWQLRTEEIELATESVAVQIIGNLDRNGYLCASTEEIAESCQKTVEEVEEVLSVIQDLDPSGIAARDLRECLLIQLDHMGYRGSLVWRIVADHLVRLETNMYEAIAKAEKVEIEDIFEAVRFIRSLEPRPGRQFSFETPVYVTPDVYVERVGEEYLLSLNDAGLPKLRLNSKYQELLEGVNANDSGEKEYLKNHLQAASWLLKSIQQRQRTIYRVTESIMRQQKEFLEQGVAALKPLVLRDVANDVGMHESTISRVTTNKYVHTPWGVFELKYFFTSGLNSEEGRVSSESVRKKIQELVDTENQKKPLSDQAIAEMLQADGIDIARRTVAKYREVLNILSSSRRKKVF